MEQTSSGEVDPGLRRLSAGPRLPVVASRALGHGVKAGSRDQVDTLEIPHCKLESGRRLAVPAEELIPTRVYKAGASKIQGYAIAEMIMNQLHSPVKHAVHAVLKLIVRTFRGFLKNIAPPHECATLVSNSLFRSM